MLRGPDVRLRLITALLIAVLLPIIGQLLRLQILEHSRYHADVETLVRRQYALPEPPWGVILDRNGDLLVGNVPVYDIGIEVNMVQDVELTVAALAPLLNQPAETLRELLTMPADTNTLVWQPLASGVSVETAKEIEALDWPWITMTPTWQRFYAEGALAAHTLGFVNANGLGYGVEAFQQRFLRGEPVQRVGVVSGDASPLPGEIVSGNMIPYAGTDLRLTIDRTMQAFVEGELEKALVEYNATGGTILVMNPQTGEILALASRPAYEPYLYAEYAARGEEKSFIDSAVSVLYEPGSVFKVVTVAAALDSGKVTLDWSYSDQGAVEYGGVTVHNSDRAAYGQQNLQGILNYSLNVGAATLTTRAMGPETFFSYVRAFGFGRTTGIEVSGEASGYVHMPTDWDWADSYLATNSFGQGIAVTPLQMATAVAAIANHGVMMQPHVIAERRYSDGRSVTIPPRSLGQPISAETANTVSELMARAVDKEVAGAQVPGYRIAGKSGTAQIPTKGGYELEAVISSFVGFGPLPDPEVLILVKIDRPDVPVSMRWGLYTAVPVFQRVAERVFVLMGVPPSDLRVGP
ncbi:MAG: penicillin-binding protein 2 [Anaerolineae bacterium]|nr:penicillin-binding protein 2 [Anaerolineae bacterium]